MTHPDFLINLDAIFTPPKPKTKPPDITELNHSVFNELAQFYFSTVTSGKSLVEILLLAPELFKLSFFEIVKITILPLFSRLLRLSQPFRIIATILKVELKLTNAIAPIIRVAQE